MKTSFYIAVNARGAARYTKGKPGMRAGEVAVRITLDIPDEAFRMPFVDANIEVPEGYVIKPDIMVWLEPELEVENDPAGS